jgi:hypothetical protein
MSEGLLTGEEIEAVASLLAEKIIIWKTRMEIPLWFLYVDYT